MSERVSDEQRVLTRIAELEAQVVLLTDANAALRRAHGPGCDACDPLTAHVRIAELVAGHAIMVRGRMKRDQRIEELVAERDRLRARVAELTAETERLCERLERAEKVCVAARNGHHDRINECSVCVALTEWEAHSGS